MRRAAAVLALAVLAAAPAFAGDAAPAPRPAAGAAAASASAPGDKNGRTAEQIAALKKAILDGFSDPQMAVRAAATDVLLAAWPDSAPILDEALVSKDPQVRLSATCVLGRQDLGDMRDRIRARLADADDLVRRQAVRAARHLDWTELEPSLMRIVSRDPAWIVRQEALKGLLDRGTLACLTTVLEGWQAEKDDEHRARYKRVLVKILGTDAGEDVEAWRTAIDKALEKARAAKK
jgi:HEAT repeat protein